MSFESEIKELRKKRIEEGIKPRKLTDTVKTDIAPLREKEDTSGLFKAGTLDDDFISLRDALALGGTATLGDISAGILQGVGGLVEGVTDLGAYGVAGILHATGNHSAAWDVKNLAKEDTVAGFMNDLREKSGIREHSFLGDFGYDASSAIGRIIGLGVVGEVGKAANLTIKGLKALSTIVSGLSSFGSAMGESYNNGGNNSDSVIYGASSAAIETLSEIMFDGFGSALNKLGVGVGVIPLDDLIAKGVTKNISNKFVKNLAQYGIKASAEGVEELVAGFFTAVAKKATYESGKGFGDILRDEELMKQAFSGFLVSAILQGGDFVKSVEKGTDFISGLTDNEQKVVDKVYENRVTEAEKNGKLTSKEKNKIYDEVMEDLKEGGIDIETINDVLGVNDSYKAYTEAVKNREALKDELKTLREMESGKRNDFQEERLNELKEMNLSDDTQINKLRDSFYSELSPKIKDSYLSESYNERARRGEKFTADLTKYKGKQAEIVQKAIDSGFLNNTRKTHALVDLIAKVGGDKDIGFDFTNNEKLKNSGFAVEGRIINGYVTKDGVTVNINSKKALNSVVGHEITHVLEGTELYNELRNAVYEYSKTKGDYDGRRANIEKLYEGIKDADVDAELTADLIGDYLFTDTDFVRSLSTKNRNLFEKLFDEIKYLCKVATAGSKEARQLEAVKKAFQEAYRESGKSTRDDTNSLKQVESGENATEQPTEVNLSEKLSPEDAQAMNIMASNIVKAAKATGLSLDDYYKATENINAFNPTRADANALADALAEYVEVMDKDVYRGYLEKIREFGGGVKYSFGDGRGVEVVDGIAVSSEVAEIMKSKEYSKPGDYMTQYSISTTEDWARNYLEKHSGENAYQVVEAIRDFTDKMVQDDAVRGYVPTGEYKYTKMGPLRSNQEYVVTFDMDTSCPRTFQFLNFRDAIQRRSNRYLTYNESINLLELMRAYGQQIPCCYCYVENKRVLLSASYNNFFGFRNAVMTAKTDAEAAKAMYGYSEKKGLPEASKKALARWRSDLSYNPSVTEVWKATNTARNSVLNYLDAQMEMGKITPKTAESKLNNMVLEQFGIKDKGAIAEVQTFVKDWTYDTLANIPHIYNIDNDTDVSMVDEKALALNHEALAYSKSASSAKSVENYVPYTDQLKNVNKEDREYIMGMGGIRKHSSNDFRMDYVQDYFLFYADLAADEWTGHTYTKSADFTKVFACTNDRINMSVAFYEDADGTLRENIDEGASWKDVRELRKAYKNVGSMAMVTSDNQLSYALNSDWIDMIIPFHASGLDKSVWYNLRMWNDYTTKQGERFYNADTMKQKLSEAGVEIPKGANATQIKSLFEETFQVKRIYGKDGEVVKPHFFPGDTYVNGQLVPGHHNDAETYFRLCEEYGVHPRFYGIKVTDTNGNQIDATEHPSYLKLIKETSRTDSAQETIQFNFGNYDAFLKMTPFEYAMKRLQEEANNGGFENTKADPYGVVDEFINEYLGKDRPLGYLTERAKETREILLEMSKDNAAKQAEIVQKEVDALSLSAEGEQPTRVRGGIYGEDVLLEEAPMKQTVVEDVAPINSNVTNTNVGKTSKQSTKDAVKEIYAENGWGDIANVVVDEDTGHAVDIGGLVDGIFTQWDMGDGIKGNAIFDLLDKKAVYEDGELTNEDELHSIIEEKLKEAAPVYNSPLPAFAHNQFEFYKNAISEERAKAKNNRKPSMSEVKRLALTKKSDRKEKHGVLTSDGKQYWSNNAFFVVESNNPDTTVTENKFLAVDRFKDILKKANDNASETKYKIDPIDVSLIRKQAPKGMSVVAVGDGIFDIRYVDAVLKAIENPEVQLTTLNKTNDTLLIKGRNGQALVVGINPNANKRGMTFAYKADEVSVPQTDIAPVAENIAPVKETVSDETPIAPIRSNVETETVAPPAVNEPPIITTKQKIAAQVKASQTELEKNIQARKDSSDFYDKEIAHAQSLLDGKKNKNTKAAQALVRRIERLTRLKSSEDANFQKRINDIESRIERLNDKSLSNHDRADNLERYKKRENAKLEAEKGVLAEEFEERRANLQSEIGDKDSFISNRASELYNEVSNLKKGVRASKELGYILDHGYEWKSIKTALINVKHRPNQTVNANSAAESVVREMLNEEYENKVYELDELDNEYNEAVAKLEAEAEKKLEAFKVANQRIIKQQEYSALMENLVGDTSTWVDKKLGLQYKTNTLRRNLRDIVRDENGNKDIAKADAIYDELQGKYNHNEASLNRETNQIKKPYADMKFTKAEDAYIQMLGEFRHNPDTSLTKDVVEEFYNKHKDSIDVAKVDRAIDMARETYDSLLERVNEVLREQGMKEIPYRKGYFPHFTEDKQNWLAKLLNWKTQNNEIPTDIAGLTEQFNPNRSWQSFNKQRRTDETDYSFSKGLDTYVQGSLDWIYHIEDIQKRRALENYIRYSHSEQGVKDKIDAIRKSTQYDADEMQEQIDLVYKNANNPLNNFVSDLRAGTNRLANKKSSLDRGMEEMVNRKVYSTMTNLSNRVSANMVAGSISSALTNFIPITQSWGQVSPVSSLRAMGETIRSAFKNDGVVDKSDFLTNRLNTAENLYKTTWDKIGEGALFLAETFDNFTSQTVWRSKYIENINNGMSESAAIKDADQFAENVMGGRSRGNNPTIFDSKNPLIKTLTAFQLEVNNQYGYMFKDMPTDMRSESLAKLVKGYATMFIGAYVYNALYSSLTGRDAAFDPIGIIEELLGDLFDDEEEETDVLMNLVDNVVEEVPFVGGIVGGGRIPISSALPYGEGLYEAFSGTMEDIGDKDFSGLTKEWLNPLIYLALPMGGGQIKKTVQGLSMFSDDHPIAGSYTDSGSLRFPVEDTIGNRIQAGLFGQWANKNAQTYLDKGYAPLDEKLVKEYKDVGMPINDYWEYRRGLNKYSTLAEKADYINSLNLTTEQKNILINNLSDRKEPIDMTNYGNYGSFEEFDFATKNPGKYTVSKAVGGYEAYKQYLSDLNNIKSDKDKYGNSITNSRKTKVVEYINGLDISYEEKIILYKSEYKSDDSFNYEIVNYLNSREDLSYNDIKSILTELGFHVDSKGNISWD